MKTHLDKLNSRPLSWSSISSFEYDPKEWARKYLEGKETPPSAEMVFGSKVGKKLETDLTFLPMIPRYSKMEHPFNVKMGDILLTGYADSLCTLTNKKLAEYKTGVKKWDQKRVNQHGQIDMYLLMHYITTRVKPEEVEVLLIWLPTQRRESGTFEVDISFVEPIEDHIKFFKAKRSMVDILKFAGYIKAVVEKMRTYALSYPDL